MNKKTQIYSNNLPRISSTYQVITSLSYTHTSEIDVMDYTRVVVCSTVTKATAWWISILTLNPILSSIEARFSQQQEQQVLLKFSYKLEKGSRSYLQRERLRLLSVISTNLRFICIKNLLKTVKCEMKNIGDEV